MLPLFKSHYSIGKSILTIEDIFELSKKEERIVVVEDSLASLRKFEARLEKEDIPRPFIFGLRIKCSDDGESSKVIGFAKNQKGIQELKLLFTKAFVEREGVADFKDFMSPNIQTAFPFYDSFVHKNLHYFGNHTLPYERLKDPIFFEEDNGHPFDFQIKKALNKLGVKTTKAKTVLYKEKSHFPLFQCYKANCSRKLGRKSPTFDRPEIDDCSSDKFCWEEYERLRR